MICGNEKSWEAEYPPRKKTGKVMLRLVSDKGNEGRQKRDNHSEEWEKGRERERERERVGVVLESSQQN